MVNLLEHNLPVVRSDGTMTNENVQIGGLNNTAKNPTFIFNSSGAFSVTASSIILNGPISGNTTQVTNYTSGPQTLTPSQGGSLIGFNAAAGFTINLPAPAVGLGFEFYVLTSVTSSNLKVLTDAASTFIIGGVAMGEAAGTTTLEAIANGTTIRSITMNGTTTGGLIGTAFNLTCVTSTQWLIEGIVAGSGTLATPFATS